MGWETCEMRWHMEMLRLWNRLVDMNENRLTKKIFRWDKSLCLNNWSSDIHLLLQNNNLVNIFDQGILCDFSRFKSEQLENYGRDWRNMVEQKPKLRTYATFKTQFAKENYLNINLSRWESPA